MELRSQGLKVEITPGQSWQMFPGIRLSFTVCLAVLFISEDLLNHQRPFKTLRMLETF